MNIGREVRRITVEPVPFQDPAPAKRTPTPTVEPAAPSEPAKMPERVE